MSRQPKPIEDDNLTLIAPYIIDGLIPQEIVYSKLSMYSKESILKALKIIKCSTVRTNTFMTYCLYTKKGYTIKQISRVLNQDPINIKRLLKIALRKST